MLLSNEELQAKIGAKQDNQVRKWLNERHIKWLKDKNGKAITTVSAIEKVLFKDSEDDVDF